MTVGTGRVSTTIFIPQSVAHVLQLHLYTGLTPREAVEILDREGVFIFLRYILERTFNPLYGVRGRVKVLNSSIVFEVLEIDADKRYDVRGRVVVDPHRASLYVDLVVVGAKELKTDSKKPVDTYVVSVFDDIVELRFYV